MDNGLLVLKLVLDELNVPSAIENLDDRKRVQKAIYLAQLSGVDLGYRYGWYLKGPYSTSLTKDYFSLAEAEALGDRDWEGKRLRESVRDRLDTIRPLLTVPQNVTLGQEDWLELVASLHYLRTVRGIDQEGSLGVLSEEKPQLVQFAPAAQQALQSANLLPAH
jgi:uncharacterized protein YwgA